MRIQMLMNMGRMSEAEEAIREDLLGNMENPQLFSLLAIALNQQGKPREDEEAARQAIKLQPDDGFGHYALALSLLERNRPKDALKAIEEALQLDPDDADYYVIKARALADRSKFKKALEAAETGLAIDADHESCRFYRGVILGRLGRKDEADQESTGLLSDSPDDTNTHNSRGWVLYQAGDAIGAEQHFIEALRLDPSNDDARSGLAEALKMKNPLFGWFLRLIMVLGRVPWYFLIAGIFLIDSFCERLVGTQVVPLMVTGQVILVFFYGILFGWIVADPLFNQMLCFSRSGRWALSKDELRGVRWAALPLFIGCTFFVFWVLKSTTRAPIHCMAWFGAVRVIFEVFQTSIPWVQRRLAVLAVLVTGVAIWVEIATYGILIPELMAGLKELADPDTTEVKGEEIKELMKAILKKRQWLVSYPSLACWFAACFADDLREWLHGLAPDSE